MYRVGIGYDIHRFKKGRPLVLGGIKIPHSSGLDGHSDADALLHAIVDALLGAAGLPDIGHFFPSGDPKTKNIASSKIIARAAQEVKKKGFRIVNVDTIIITEVPKLSPHREKLRASVARLLNIPVNNIQVKGKTHEGLDALGQGRALAVHAVVLLQKA